MRSPFLNPGSVAVVGATPTETKMGHYVLKNIVEGGFKGAIYPINPKWNQILGHTAYPRVPDTPTVPDLVVVTTPAGTIPDIVLECAAIGVPAMIIISAGFAETGDEGKRLEAELLARKKKMRIAGPNCLGFMSPVHGLNATFAKHMAQPGSVGVISQSGAILTALLDWARMRHVGFSQYISLGTMLDYSWSDALYELGADPKTKSIIIYMESIGNDPRGFVSAAREISAVKPIIVMKPGKSADAARAAASHTGALTGNDDVLDACFARAGIVRVKTIDQLFDMADLARMQPPRGNGLTIITNAGGPGVMAVDALAETGAVLTALSEPTHAALDAVLPFTWSRQNPIDIIGDAGPERYHRAVQIALEAPETNALLVVLSPQVMTDPTACAHAIIDACANARVPVFVSWMGGDSVEEARELFVHAGVPTFNSPDHACTLFGYLVERSIRQKMLYMTPGDASEQYNVKAMHREIGRVLQDAQRVGQVLLPERDAKRVLRAYDIPVPKTLLAQSPDEAAECAQEIGFPVAVKLHSDTITHKTDVGGVRLNLTSQDEVRSAFTAIKEQVGLDFGGVTVQPFIKPGGVELIVGSSSDPQLGPVITFGMGGTLVEILGDVSFGLPPLNRYLARRMMESTKVWRVLEGYRGAPCVDIDGLESLLVSFARLVVEHGDLIKEVEINPLVASSMGHMALDARVILYRTGERVAPPAIRPYPTTWVQQSHGKDNTYFTVRPLRPDDEERIREFHGKLSEDSVRTRYQQNVPLATRQMHERLGPRCNIDYARHMAFVVVHDSHVLGVARMIKMGQGDRAEFSLVVLDEQQDRGIGAELTKLCLQWAEVEGIGTIEAFTTMANAPMQHLLRKFGFSMKPNPAEGTVDAVLRNR